jgi:DNA polymerase-3 subunit chi
MSNTVNPDIIFLRVTDTSTKLSRIVSTVQQHYLSGDIVTIFVPNRQAADYIDNLLWRLPPDSFIPHAVSNEHSDDRVIITQANSNINKGKIALNLIPTTCPDLESFEKIYELADQTDAQKAQQSQHKMQQYQNLGLYTP